jgi:spermidine/putrescine transport system ATP-binding protein
MTVRQNVMFGLRMARVAEEEARRRADQALELVHLPGVGERRPGQLSGGQRQRVALARALVNRPAVLLLDEPLGALDLKLRKAMQYELKQLQQQVGITFVYVTHDQEEALTMADRIAVMSAGKALQVGPPDEVYERPSSRFVADFIGETNFIDGVLDARDGALGIVRLPGGRTLRAPLRDPDAAVAGAVAVAVRPEKVGLTPTSGPSGASRHDPEAARRDLAADVRMSELRGRIVEAHYIGTDTRYRIDGGDGIRLVVRVQNQLAGYEGMLPRGTEVVARWRIDHASVLA